MGALSARSVRKRRAISDFCKTLPLEERAKFDKKTDPHEHHRNNFQ